MHAEVIENSNQNVLRARKRGPAVEKSPGYKQALSNASEDLYRQKLNVAVAIGKHIQVHGIIQKEIAQQTGLQAPDISGIVNGNVERFSLNKVLALADFLGVETRLNVGIEMNQTSFIGDD